MVTSILQLVVLGFIFWLLDRFVPMPEPIKIVVRVIMVLVLVLFLLNMFGLWHGGPRL